MTQLLLPMNRKCTRQFQKDVWYHAMTWAATSQAVGWSHLVALSSTSPQLGAAPLCGTIPPNTAAELLTVHSPDSPPLCLSTGLQKHLNNSLQAEVSYKMCQGRVAVLYGQAVWGTRPREVTALHNSEAVKQLTQIAVLTLVLLTLVLPLKLILLLSRASQEKHPKL